ncbi:hypothetical protein ACFX1W_010294 [Malus domestica]
MMGHYLGMVLHMGNSQCKPAAFQCPSIRHARTECRNPANRETLKAKENTTSYCFILNAGSASIKVIVSNMQLCAEIPQ